jgi:hypothetical protein
MPRFKAFLKGPNGRKLADVEVEVTQAGVKLEELKTKKVHG